MRSPRRRFFAKPEALDTEPLAFAAREAHHIAAVLRLRAGEPVVVFDGRREVDAVLLDVSDERVTARRQGEPRRSQRPVDVTLLQGLARRPKMDLIVRIATELGLAAIFPVLTARSLPDPGPARLTRWERIAQEASRQCGRGDLPEIRPAAALGAVLEALEPVDIFVVPWEEETRPMGTVIAGTTFARAAVLVGPEGGLTPEEIGTARAAGGQTVSLGPLILRTETAGLVTAAMLLYERLLRP